MTKKTKFATALLATALLSNGFTLDHEEEVTRAEPKPTEEVIAEKEIKIVIEPQHLVAEEEIQVELFEEESTIKEEHTLPAVPTNTEPPPTPEPQQVTSLPENQGNTDQTIQPDLPSKPVYTEEQLTDPIQKPDGTLVEVYVQEVTPPTTTTEENSCDLAYVPGFGWVPIPEACEVIFAEDMFQNGNKVGTMGGG